MHVPVCTWYSCVATRNSLYARLMTAGYVEVATRALRAVYMSALREGTLRKARRMRTVTINPKSLATVAAMRTATATRTAAAARTSMAAIGLVLRRLRGA